MGWDGVHPCPWGRCRQGVPRRRPAPAATTQVSGIRAQPGAPGITLCSTQVRMPYPQGQAGVQGGREEPPPCGGFGCRNDLVLPLFCPLSHSPLSPKVSPKQTGWCQRDVSCSLPGQPGKVSPKSKGLKSNWVKTARFPTPPGPGEHAQSQGSPAQKGLQPGAWMGAFVVMGIMGFTCGLKCVKTRFC